MDGFSLVELLVALAVFALVVLGLLHMAAEGTRATVLVEERVLAGVVADNQAAEAVLAPIDQLAAPATGEVEFGGRHWAWHRSAQPTAEARVLRVDIAVTVPGDGHVVAERSVLRSAR